MSEDFDLNRDAEKMLIYLHTHGKTKTSELRQALELDKNQPVNYRGKRILASGREDADLAL